MHFPLPVSELTLSHEKLYFVIAVLVGLLWDHCPLSTEVWGKVTPRRVLGDNPSSSLDSGSSLSFPGPQLLPAGFVRSSPTPWSGPLLVFGDGVAVGGDLLVGRLGRVPSCKASSPLAAFYHPGAVAPSPGSQLAVPTEIEGTWKQEPWMRVCSSLVAINHWQGWGRTMRRETANKQFALLEQHEALSYNNWKKI